MPIISSHVSYLVVVVLSAECFLFFFPIIVNICTYEKISNFRDEMTVASVTDSPPLSNLESNCTINSLSYTVACEFTPYYPLSSISSDSDLTSENLDNYSF